MTVETERLIVDAIKETDKDDYFSNVSHDKKVLETFMCKYTDTLDELDFAPYVKSESIFAIRKKETGRLIGIILYFEKTETSCEIGYCLGSSHWGKGYATEAARSFVAYCFEKLGVKTVYASFFTGNDASRRVMEKCGMKFDRFSEKELTYLGVERDLTYYSIKKKEENMKEYIAYCGLDCEKCEARKATVNNDDELRKKVSKLWSELNGVEITPEMINCLGCRTDGVKTVYCDSLCPIRQCALGKKYNTCGDCSEIDNCEKVGMITKNNAEALNNLKG